MNSENAIELSSEIKKAIDDGYQTLFIFLEGFLCCEIPQRVMYLIKDVYKKPYPDPEQQIIVYRVETPDGLKGYAFTGWEHE